MELTAKKVVVVAVDFTECGDDALSVALNMLQDGQATALHMLNVIDPDTVIDQPEKPALQAEEELLETAPHRLLTRAHELVFLDPSRKPLLKAHARIGQPVPTILQLCVDYDADLLIVGTHAREGLERALLGSVAEALVRRAPCPVLVARPVNYEGRAKTPLPDRAYHAGETPAEPEVPFQRTTSTSSDGWRPADNGPTGFRIV